MSNSHTPTPWKLGAEYGNLKTEIVAQDRAIAVVWTKNQIDKCTFENWAEGMANAAHIVRCVNNFDALIEALRIEDVANDGSISVAEQHKIFKEHGWDEYETWEAWLALKRKAAIANATRKV